MLYGAGAYGSLPYGSVPGLAITPPPTITIRSGKPATVLLNTPTPSPLFTTGSRPSPLTSARGFTVLQSRQGRVATLSTGSSTTIV